MIVRSIAKRLKQISTVIIGALVLSTLTFIPSSDAQTKYKPRQDYYCAQLKGEWYTWFKHPLGEKQRVALIRWDTTVNEKWTPKNRCIAVSNRFQALLDNGWMTYFVGDKVNGLPVLCGARKLGDTCFKESDNIVNLIFTLKPGENPDLAADKLFKLRTRATGNILRLNGNRCFKNLEDYQKYLETLKQVEQNNNSENIKICFEKNIYYDWNNLVKSISDYEQKQGNLVNESALIPVTK